MYRSIIIEYIYITNNIVNGTLYKAYNVTIQIYRNSDTNINFEISHGIMNP